MSDEETIREALMLLSGHGCSGDDPLPTNWRKSFPALEALCRLSEQNKRLREAVEECREVCLGEYGKASAFEDNFPKCAAILRAALAASDTAS